jgi:Ca2+-binding RTX toxin-like protein
MANFPTEGDDVINGTAEADLIEALGGNDVINGRGGADTMRGGSGNDSYFVDHVGDLAEEVAEDGDGTDTVRSTVSFVLGDFVENLTLLGTGNINGTGNGDANVIIGNAGRNRLTGGGGIDTMKGGKGNDTYVIGLGDQIFETADGGTADRVQSALSYTLRAHFEDLTLTGAAHINGIGNDAANLIVGNSGNNRLDGRGGADTLEGGLGNDVYTLGLGDTATEAASAGIDTVQTALTHTLGANIENLTLTGGDAVNGTGNDLANVIVGNAAANRLSGGIEAGGAQADTLKGGNGNDVYVVGAGDKVFETSALGGLDMVESSVSFRLGMNLENLDLTGSAAINGTGNSLANMLFGNGAANVLTGEAGADYIDGGSGADTMRGGTENDIYVVDSVSDVVEENANEGFDTIGTLLTSMTLNVANVEGLVYVGTGNFTGTGNDFNNLLGGGIGADTLNGAGGSDIMTGERGIDTVSGGAGGDHFLFRVPLGAANRDIINDFDAAEDDFYLHLGTFTAFEGTGTIDISAFTTGSQATDEAHRIIYDSETGNLFYDADGSGGGFAQQLFAHIGVGHQLSHASFETVVG